jgi:hypothetical protein
MIEQEEQGRLAANIVRFCRTLRRAGLPVGTGQVIDALAAVTAVGLERRDDFCRALSAVLVKDPGQFRLFRQAFQIYFRNPRLLERMVAMLLPGALGDAGAGQDVVLRRLAEAMGPPGQEASDDVTVEVDRTATWSDREILRQKDFEQMTLEEQSEAKELLREEIVTFEKVGTRRFRASRYGNRYDLRRSMQTMMRNNGQLIELARKRRVERAPVLVLICDISGSMSRYSRLFLHFAHALSASSRTVHCFVFGTRLTNISRRLRDRDVDHALSQIATDVLDWDGGTRIAESLARFNKDWSRRVLAQNAVVILLTDGLERDSEADLAFEMQRLRRSCREVIWLNPVLRYAGFEPKASGIRKMLPHVDHFLPAHSVASLADLGSVLTHAARWNGHGVPRPREILT